MIPFIFWDNYKDTHPFDYRIALIQGLKRLNRADMIISPSEATKKDILKYGKCSDNHIKVIYEGVRQDLLPLDKLESRKKIEQEYGIKGNYILYLGGADFRKNIYNLLLSFSKALKKYRLPHSLVLAGEVFERTSLNEVKTIFEFIRELYLEKHMKILGFIPKQHINYLYSGADLFIMPSLYEGFGLPVLEAMACGTPVITSHISSLPEIAGNAAFLIDPHDVDAITDAIDKVLTDTTLNNGLVQNGLQRAKLFTWEKTARETLAVYKNLASQ
jgi:glycosyltransferase involved in cell wall biosynthesis